MKKIIFLLFVVSVIGCSNPIDITEEVERSVHDAKYHDNAPCPFNYEDCNK